MKFFSGPYSDSDPNVVDERMRLFYETVANLSAKHVYGTSPLLLVPCLKYNKSLGSDYSFWKDYCEQLITICDELIVFDHIPGWDKSSGVKAEIEFAISLGIKVTMYSQM